MNQVVGEEARSAQSVAEYLADIADEVSPRRFKGYISELQPIVPQEVFEQLQEAYRQLACANMGLKKAIGELNRSSPASQRHHH